MTSKTRAARPAEAPLPASTHAWLGTLGFRRSDLLPFREDLRVADGALGARHRDAAGRPLGWEWASASADGRLRYRCTAGMRRCLVRSQTPEARRLVLTDGPLPAIAAAALADAVSGSIYAGGGWTELAEEAVRALVTNGVREVVLAYAATPVGARMAEMALSDLADLAASVAVQPPPTARTWLDALASARLTGESR